MADGKQNKPAMPGEAGSADQRPPSGLTRPGELFLPGDALPVPDVVEKNTDSVWALWSDMVEGENESKLPGDKDFTETVPMHFHATAQIPLTELPKPDKDTKGRAS